MKKTVVASFIIVSFVFYALLEQLKSNSSQQETAFNPSPAPLPTTSGPSPQPITSSPGQYKDGQYTGDRADAFYGNIQVKVTVGGGKITNVQFLDYPQDRDRSIAINRAAIPLLSSEAIQAQSANVDVISGATATSQAFVQSLQSALDQAK